MNGQNDVRFSIRIRSNTGKISSRIRYISFKMTNVVPSSVELLGRAEN